MTKARILADYVAGGTTAAEFDYMDGVTSNVQTQMNAKAPLADPDLTGNVDITGNAPVLKLATNTNATNAEIQLHGRSSDGNPSANKVHLKGIAVGSDEATRFGVEVMSAADGTMPERLSVTNSGKVGIGTTSPLGKIDLRGTYTAPSTDIGNSAIFCASSEAATSSADKGGVIQFGGNYTGTTPTQWAGIVGLKDNNTDANYAGYLAFYTRAQGAAPVERMRIKSTGDIHLGTPDASFCSSEESTGSLAADATYYFQWMGCNCAYLFTYWNDDGNAYGHGISAVQTGGYSSQITTVVGYQSHYGATEAPTLAVNQSGCNWRVSLYNNDSDAKNFYGKFLSLGKD